MKIFCVVAVLIACFIFNPVYGKKISFVGRQKKIDDSKMLHITAKLYPGALVIFEDTSSQKITLRKANPEEYSNDKFTIYRFERDENINFIFYEVNQHQKILELDFKHKKNTSTNEGKEYENVVSNIFVSDRKSLTKCAENSRYLIESMTAYIEISTDGKQQNMYVIPEGSLSECIKETTKSFIYPKTKMPFTAKFTIRIN